MATINGTAGADTLIGTSGDDIIEGFDGDDILIDTLGGGDTLRGGDGNDMLTLKRAQHTLFPPTRSLDGGNGDDVILVEYADDASNTTTITGGAGDDRVTLIGVSGTVDLGTGNDTLFVGTPGSSRDRSVAVTLGAGADTIVYGGWSAFLTVSDFSVASGDRLRFADSLAANLIGWDQRTNPFAGGFLSLVQLGADVQLTFDRDGSAVGGSSQVFVMTLKNVQASSLTADALGGWSADGRAPVGLVNAGTGADDVITGGVGDDSLSGGDGNDTIVGGIGNDTITGGLGDDRLDGGAGDDIIDGGDGADVITDAYGANNTLRGGAGNDRLSLVQQYAPGGGPNEPYSFGGTIDGGADDDIILVQGAGFDASGAARSQVSVFGGSGNDQVTFLQAAGTIDLGTGDDLLSIDYTGGNASASNPYLSIHLGDGRDRVRFLAGAQGNAGSPVTIDDFRAGAGGDVLDLSDALPNALLRWDGATNPFALGLIELYPNGANGTDTIVRINGAFVITLGNVAASSLTAENFGGFDPAGTAPAPQTLTGTDGNDTIAGTVGADLIQGFGGDDVLNGGIGNDRIEGGAGNDRLDGGAGVDRLEGGEGNDVLIDATKGGDALYGGAGDDVLTVTAAPGYDAVSTGLILDGGDGNDSIDVRFDYDFAKAIVPTITGGTGNDLITVKATNAGTVDAGSGDDRVAINGEANATITLGAGADVLAFSSGMSASGELGTKVVTDFQAGDAGDVLDLRLVSNGNLTVTQLGANAVVQLVQRGGTVRTVVTLQNVNVADLSPYNLGFSNPAYVPPGITVTGTDGDDNLVGTDRNDRLYGMGGNDVLSGGAGDDFIDGGAGNDRASYTGLFRGYAPSTVGGVTTLQGPASEGTDTLVSVENIVFKDGVLQSDPDAAFAQVERLYLSVLGRAPDAIGLDFYVDRIEDRQAALVSVANDLIGSAEFQAATGGLTNAQFVDYVYQHALGRAPDAGGKAFYTQALDNGLSRGGFVVDLSESAEHRAATADLVTQGFFNTDDDYQSVALLYDGFFDRLPDQNGLTFYAEAVKDGRLSLGQIASEMAGSTEFRAMVDGKSNAEIVDLVYQNALDRAPDAGGAAFYTNQLNNGTSIEAFVADLAFSQEHANLLAPHILAGIVVV